MEPPAVRHSRSLVGGGPTRQGSTDPLLNKASAVRYFWKTFLTVVPPSGTSLSLSGFCNRCLARPYPFPDTETYVCHVNIPFRIRKLMSITYISLSGCGNRCPAYQYPFPNEATADRHALSLAGSGTRRPARPYPLPETAPAVRDARIPFRRKPPRHPEGTPHGQIPPRNQ